MVPFALYLTLYTHLQPIAFLLLGESTTSQVLLASKETNSLSMLRARHEYLQLPHRKKV